MEDTRVELGRFGKGRLERWGEALILHVAGEPYERGRQHGALLGDLIETTMRKGLSSAAAVCGKAVGGDPELGLERLRQGSEEAEGYLPPELTEEIRGIADALAERGSALDLRDFLTWNLMYDTWCFYAHPRPSDPSAEFPRSPYPEAVGCSSFSAWGGATKDGALLFGKNMDNLDLPGIPEGRVLVFCDPEGGLGHVNFTQAGMLAVDGGFNEAGMAMMTHYSGSTFETMRGCGIGSLTRLLLQRASRLRDAEELLTVYPRCTGINYHVADAKAKKAAVVEANAKETAIRLPYQKEALWSTNHCNCYPGWMGYEGKNMVAGQAPVYGLADVSNIEAWQLSLREKDNPNIAATGRFRRYQALIEETYGQLDVEAGMRILRDRRDPDTGEERPWDRPAKARNDGMTISYLLPRKSFAEDTRLYKADSRIEVTGQSTNLWSAVALPGTGEIYAALEGLPAHRRSFRYFNLLKELGR